MGRWNKKAEPHEEPSLHCELHKYQGERREKERKEWAISRAQQFDTLEMDEVIQEERGKGGGNGLGLTGLGQCTAECTALPHPKTVK